MKSNYIYPDEMIDLYLKGFVLGIVLTCMVGPIFFAIVESSLQRGWPSGAWVGAGVWTSDLLYITACLIAIAPLSRILQPETESILHILAGLFFLLFGLYLLFKRQQPILPKGEKVPTLAAQSWGKGFLVNTINPFTLLFWVGTSLLLLTETNSNAEATQYYLGVMTTVVAGDIGKVFLADRIRSRIREGGLHLLRKISGLGFSIFGIWLMIDAFFL